MELNPRRVKFEELKNSVKEEQNYLLIGIDIAKDKHDACIILSSGKILNKHFPFENNLQGYKEFTKKIREYIQSVQPDEVIIGVETTGNYMVALADYLSKEGFFVVQVSSFVTKRNRDTLDLSWNKNDVKDALNIADCMKQGKIMFYDVSGNVYANIRRLVGLYERLSRAKGYCVIRIQNNVLCISFPEFTKIYPIVGELVPLTILERYPLPSDILKLSENDFIEDIRKHSDLSIKRSKLIALYRLAKESIGSTLDKESLRIETRFIVHELQRIKREQKDLLMQVQEFCNQLPEYELLQTIPGIGPVIGAGLLAEIGDIKNYRSARQIIKLAGMDLACIQSGRYQGQVHISRRGRPRLRMLAFQAGLVAVRYDTRLRLKYLYMIEKKKIKRGAKRKIIMAISSKILRIVYGVLKNRMPYEREFDQNWTPPVLSNSM